ncbi:MAG: sialate O-acetylesterase [Planctomycetaceae bacterium]
MRFPILRTGLCLAGLLLCVSDAALSADGPFLHPLFSDHAVLQRGIEVPVWGWTAPGADVRVTMQGKSVHAKADESGRWLAKLPPLVAGGPFQMDVVGPQTVHLKDVLVGEVWICSGQSNMEWPVTASNDAENEVKKALHPRIRLFTVPKKISLEPQSLVESSWQLCTPETIGNFSAVGFYFGRELQPKIDLPVGLIHTSWGGTVAEAWTSGTALNAMPDFQPAVAQVQQQAEQQKAGATGTLEEQMAKWWTDNDPGSKPDANWHAIDVPAEGWQAMNLPAAWESAGLDGFDGIVWFRKSVELPAELAGKTATLELGPIDDRDDTFFNGQRVGGQNVWTAPRTFPIPAGQLKVGANIIAVRVLDTGGGGGIYGQPEQLRLVIPVQEGVAEEKVIPLAGEWQYRASTPIAQLPPVPQSAGQNPNVATVLYNGMVAPLEPYGVRGAIWYQGESNAGRAEQYATLLPTLIGDWRNRFASPGFDFMIVQLANFMAVQTTPVENGWADLRDAQARTAKADPRVGLAVITDIGDAADIHPRNKQDVGKRLALQALAISYGKTDIVPAGPEFAEVTRDGANLRVKFLHADGLEAKGGELKGFAIAGADGNFVWAKGTIEGDTVVLNAAEGPEPTMVKYNWANNPIGNLFNGAKLPAAPFQASVAQ